MSQVAEAGQRKVSLSKFQSPNNHFVSLYWQSRLCKNYEITSNTSSDLIIANVSTGNALVYIFQWVAKMDSCVAKD